MGRNLGHARSLCNTQLAAPTELCHNSVRVVTQFGRMITLKPVRLQGTCMMHSDDDTSLACSALLTSHNSKCCRKGKFEPLDELFDITKLSGEWFNATNKKLYHKQVDSKCRVGYSTGKLADKKTIHPSKRRSNEAAPSGSSGAASAATEHLESDTDEFGSDDSEDYCGASSDERTPTKRQCNKSKTATRLGVEHKAVMLKNESREIRLAALQLPDGQSATIADGLEKVLDEFHLWEAITMIVADTTNVNTRGKNGAVVRLQRLFKKKGHAKPLFICCQHHVLDRIVRVVTDYELGGATKTPNIEHYFVHDIITKYADLQKFIKNVTHEIIETAGWRDGMKFLHQLTRAFRHFHENQQVPLIKFQKIPNISNARWNSRAILALLAFFLMPQERERLQPVCQFIAYDWADLWFSDLLHVQAI
ncbi:hypothetical protein CAPTEDRAFT_208021 [Capitella teleta]|uniref:Uncharacterized protein n=1 Tax=Capitella teleta TaxID=283909 RepID=R7VFD7_CAPTE|nr:hypothetical protein CAPTEDRAFT_208021 [Capitella teleta]|eukprot:ELU17277.1 hypothetical protein CAPTEDRAFT_208021 [Capitella teleta]